jgi:hypothetical protein
MSKELNIKIINADSEYLFEVRSGEVLYMHGSAKELYDIISSLQNEFYEIGWRDK